MCTAFERFRIGNLLLEALMIIYLEPSQMGIYICLGMCA